MPHLAINSDDQGAFQALRDTLQAVRPGLPIVILVHGFRYCPHSEQANPHNHILSEHAAQGCWKSVSWPRKLTQSGEDALVIAYGWPARASLWQAYGQAEPAATRLATLLSVIHAEAPERDVHLMGHSLGARVVLRALAEAPRDAVRRAILLYPAVFAREVTSLTTRGALDTAEIISILGRENTAFDLMLRAAMPQMGSTLGGGGPERATWLDLRLDCPHTLTGLRDVGLRVAPPLRRVCHWSAYLRPGVWRLYRQMLYRPTELSLAQLRAVTRAPAPAPAAPDWAALTS